MKGIFSLALAFGLMILLAVMACKNISYPLLCSDESETIMTAQQITLYGYPKVHDGKNTVFIPDNPLWLGYKPSESFQNKKYRNLQRAFYRKSVMVPLRSFSEWSSMNTSFISYT
jgi:hypothetical protein